MPKSSVAFEVTDGEIRAFWFAVPPFGKLVHNSPVVKFDRLPIPTGVIEQGTVRDEKTLVDILTSYRLQYSGKYQKAFFAVSLQQGFIGSYTLPWLSKSDRKSAIPLLVDEEISIPRSDLLYDYLVISEEKPKSLQIILGAARRSILEQYAFIFGEAGFKVTGADFAYSVLAQALGFEADMDVLYLQGESENIQMVYFRGVVPRSVRSLPPLQAQKKWEDREKGQIEEWKNEIGRFLLYYRTQYPDYDLKLIIWSGGPDIELLAQEAAAANHGLEARQVLLRDIPDSWHWQGLLKECKGFGEAVVGYGLRILTRSPGLNLWREPMSKQTLKKIYLGLALLTSLFLLAETLSGVILCSMAQPLQEEVRQLENQGMKIVDYNKQQEAFRAAWLKASQSSGEIGERLAQVQGLSNTDVKIRRIDFKQGSLSLSGSANDSKSVQGMIQTLRVLGWEEPSLTTYKLTALNTVEFKVSAKQRDVLFQDADPEE